MINRINLLVSFDKTLIPSKRLSSVCVHPAAIDRLSRLTLMKRTISPPFRYDFVVLAYHAVFYLLFLQIISLSRSISKGFHHLLALAIVQLRMTV